MVASRRAIVPPLACEVMPLSGVMARLDSAIAAQIRVTLAGVWWVSGLGYVIGDVRLFMRCQVTLLGVRPQEAASGDVCIYIGNCR